MRADQALAFLRGFHDDRKGASLTAASQRYYLEYLESVRPDDVRAVVVKHAVERFPRFPTIDQLRRISREVQEQLTEERRRQEARQDAQAPAVAIVPADPAHARLGFRLIREIQAGHLRGTARVAAFERMARRWPGVGWEDAIAEAKRPALSAEERDRVAGRIIPDAAARIRRCAEALPHLYARKLPGYRGDRS